VRKGGVEVALRPKEYDLLLELLRHRGEVRSRLDLMQTVWGYSSAVITRTVDTHMFELRRKLEADAARPRHIMTVRGIGYRLDD
jgi:DNA-binding response OmpR family regulator